MVMVCLGYWQKVRKCAEVSTVPQLLNAMPGKGFSQKVRKWRNDPRPCRNKIYVFLIARFVFLCFLNSISHRVDIVPPVPQFKHKLLILKALKSAEVYFQFRISSALFTVQLHVFYILITFKGRQ